MNTSSGAIRVIETSTGEKTVAFDAAAPSELHEEARAELHHRVDVGAHAPGDELGTVAYTGLREDDPAFEIDLDEGVADGAEFLNRVRETDEHDTVGYVALADDEEFTDLESFRTDALRRALLEFEREFGMGTVYLSVTNNPNNEELPLLALLPERWRDRAVVAAGTIPQTADPEQNPVDEDGEAA